MQEALKIIRIFKALESKTSTCSTEQILKSLDIEFDEYRYWSNRININKDEMKSFKKARSTKCRYGSLVWKPKSREENGERGGQEQKRVDKIGIKSESSVAET